VPVADPFGVVVICGFFAWMLMGWLATDWWLIKRESWRPVRAGVREGLCAAPATPPEPRRLPVEAVAGRTDAYGRRETLYRVTSLPGDPEVYNWGGELIRTIQSQLYTREIGHG
jgi:hypothetical protein